MINIKRCLSFRSRKNSVYEYIPAAMEKCRIYIYIRKKLNSSAAILHKVQEQNIIYQWLQEKE